jgi:hypothetical protein
VRHLLPRALTLAVALLVLGAGPAAADPAGPSDFRSVVTGIEPPVQGVHAEVTGGDTFLELRVDLGTEVVVRGYSGEPYLRFAKDGTVQRNRRSAATFLNEGRRIKVTPPADTKDPNAEPVWEDVGSGGRYAWHDHRIHWMSDVRPPVARGQRVRGEYDPWTVPIEVDGTLVAVHGTLTYEKAVSPIPWIAGGVVLLGALVVVGRRAPARVGAAALLVTSVLAVAVGRSEYASTPDGGGNPLLWVLPGVAALTAAGAVALARRASGVVLTLASVATLSGWALLRIAVVSKPVLPTTLSPNLDRATTVASLAAAMAAAYLAVTSGALKLPSLEEDPQEEDYLKEDPRAAGPGGV